ncbi:amidohydrolase [Photobacterium nomapromontoriensis]|uniref:amidohydrolase n=1 Tax=Photobacterium nomapromontoriensis TaxID=2910237 RepID=UPI003D0CB65A
MKKYNDMINWRRDFHQYPEAGWTEFFTTAKIVNLLKEMGFDIKVGSNIINSKFVRGRDIELVNKGITFAKENGVSQAMLDLMGGYTGCVAELDTGRSGPTVALRFDIDCVNVNESHHENHKPNQDEFRSEFPGLMHACGHDGHMAIGLGVARWLMDNKSHLVGKIKLLFQPAEEGVRGAAAMAESGIVDDVDYFLGMHLGFIAKSGEIVINPNNFLCTTKFDFRFYGVPAHAGAAPEDGKNALAAACNAAVQMLGISRSGKGMSRINVGVIQAGEGRNVIPSYGCLQVEVRGENSDINQYMCDQVQRIAQGNAYSFDVKLETEIMGEAVDLTNDKELVDVLSSVVDQYPNLHKIQSRSFGGSEDATILARKVQSHGGKALYFIIGSDLNAGHHQSEFDFDENQLTTGLELYTGCLLSLLKA